MMKKDMGLIKLTDATSLNLKESMVLHASSSSSSSSSSSPDQGLLRLASSSSPDQGLLRLASSSSPDQGLLRLASSPDQGLLRLASSSSPDQGLLRLASSPDQGLLRLASSPELERLIVQSNGMVTTSSQFHLYPPNNKTDEQEFAEGFVKALEDLHKQNQLNGAGAGCAAQTNSLDLQGNDTSVAPEVTLQPADLPVYTNLSSYGSALGSTSVNYTTDTVPFPPPPVHHLGGGDALQHHQHHQQALCRVRSLLKDEPQTVPEVHCGFGGDMSPPLSPINMDAQERIKAERKKLRNRIAASKCRKRKLERISRLEDKVNNLKSQNLDLASTASSLREQVARLKQKVLSHVNSGCQLVQVH